MARREREEQQIIEMVAKSVTLKEGWRKVLLPSLDLRNKKHVEAEGSSIANGIGTQLKQKIKVENRGQRKIVNYESNKLKNLVEAN